MGIRTLCFIGAVVVGDGVLRWVLIAGAFILPYIAVVMANSASPQVEGADMEPMDHGYKEIDSKESGDTRHDSGNDTRHDSGNDTGHDTGHGA